MTYGPTVVTMWPVARGATGGDHAGEGRASELRAEVGIEDVRLAVTSHSILQRLNAERRLHGDRYAPRQHATAEPIEHNGQIDEAACHRASLVQAGES